MAETRIVNAGPVGLKPKGEYSPTATYTLLDTVLYNHDSWFCKAMNQDGTAAVITGIAPSDGSAYWQALTDGGRAAYSEGETAKAKGENADAKATLAQTAAQNADAKATLAQQKAELADSKAPLADEKAALANTAASNANDKAVLADTAAQNADTKASLAAEKASLADQKATLANDKASLAAEKAALADEKAQYANEQGDYAKNIADHPSYIADGTEEMPGDKYYEYHWDYTTQRYVRGNYMKGDDLDYSTITEEERERLIEDIKQSILYASVDTCKSIVTELT